MVMDRGRGECAVSRRPKILVEVVAVVRVECCCCYCECLVAVVCMGCQQPDINCRWAPMDNLNLKN